jgi:hypothetical protein
MTTTNDVQWLSNHRVVELWSSPWLELRSVLPRA